MNSQQTLFFLSSASLLCIHTSLLTSADHASINGQVFVTQKLCPTKTVTFSQCPVTPSAHTAGQCGLWCAMDEGCRGFQFHPSTQECRVCSAVIDADCSNGQNDTDGAYLSYEEVFRCQNGGQTNTVNRCDCPASFVGDHCIRRMTDCEDWQLHLKQNALNQAYWIRPQKKGEDFFIFCDMAPSRNFLVARATDDFSFYQPWDKYANGFGDVKSDHWQGLNLWHQLTTSRCYNLYLQFILNNTTSFVQGYTHFVVSDESQLFTFTFNTTFVPAPYLPLGDCLGTLVGTPFSTYDKDNDNYVWINCAERHQSGWWMDASTGCHPKEVLTGYMFTRRVGVNKEVFWVPDESGDLIPDQVYMWLQRC